MYPVLVGICSGLKLRMSLMTVVTITQCGRRGTNIKRKEPWWLGWFRSFLLCNRVTNRYGRRETAITKKKRRINAKAKFLENRITGSDPLQAIKIKASKTYSCTFWEQKHWPRPPSNDQNVTKTVEEISSCTAGTMNGFESCLVLEPCHRHSLASRSGALSHLAFGAFANTQLTTSLRPPQC